MRFRGFKKFISVTLAVMMIVSTLICGGVITEAATYSVGDVITYQFMVNTGCKLQAFEGAVYFPADKLSVVTQTDDDGIECEAIVYGNSKGNYIAHATGGVMKFQASHANNVYDFTTDVTMIKVQFSVDNADFNLTEIYTELSNIYDKEHNANNGNNPYSYKNVIDDNVISSGTVDLDNVTSEETTSPTEATTESTEETVESTEATTESTEPTVESTEPTTESTAPTTEPDGITLYFAGTFPEGKPYGYFVERGNNGSTYYYNPEDTGKTYNGFKVYKQSGIVDGNYTHIGFNNVQNDKNNQIRWDNIITGSIAGYNGQLFYFPEGKPTNFAQAWLSDWKFDLESTTYTVVFNYKTEDGTQTLTKTATTTETDISAIANSVMPTIVNKMYDYKLGNCSVEGTTITANLVETKKLYTVTVDGKIVGTQYGYKDKATVTLVDGTEYTFYVTGDVEITSDDIKKNATLSLDALTISDTKISMDLLATANVEKFAHMGVAFATSEKSVAEISNAVSNVATGTAVFEGIAVHNSTVDSPNESGSYQFVYAPYVSKEKADKTLYFYTFVVDTDGKVYVSSEVKVDLKNAYA